MPSEKSAPVPRRGPGAAPTPLPTHLVAVLDAYTAALAAPPLAAETRRTYVSKVRQFLVWLALADVAGNPLATAAARDWAVRDYRTYLQRVAKRAPATVNTALAAVDDFFLRRGQGPAKAERVDLPSAAPRALDQRATLRFLRAVDTHASPRDRALALVPLPILRHSVCAPAALRRSARGNGSAPQARTQRWREPAQRWVSTRPTRRGPAPPDHATDREPLPLATAALAPPSYLVVVLPVVLVRADVVTTDVATAVVAILVVGMAVVVTLVVAATVVETILVVPTLVVAMPGLLGVPPLFAQPASTLPARPNATRPDSSRRDPLIKNKRFSSS